MRRLSGKSALGCLGCLKRTLERRRLLYWPAVGKQAFIRKTGNRRTGCGRYLDTRCWHGLWPGSQAEEVPADWTPPWARPGQRRLGAPARGSSLPSGGGRGSFSQRFRVKTLVAGTGQGSGEDGTAGSTAASPPEALRAGPSAYLPGGAGQLRLGSPASAARP